METENKKILLVEDDPNFGTVLKDYLTMNDYTVVHAKNGMEGFEKFKKDDVVLFRIEQLYPFPAKTLVKELKPYAKNSKFFWCQEEPKNMGAWFSVRDYIQWTLDTIKANNKEISYIGRSPDASPATGYAKRHISQQQEIINKVFE